MTTLPQALVGARIHDGATLFDAHALALDSDGVTRIVRSCDLPEDCATTDLHGGLILPGFVDVQINGGGGVMFNDDQSVQTLRIIAAAHATTGTAALLPTLITDTPARTRAAILAVKDAIDQAVPGIIGLHLEGPHLSVARKGAHDPALIRPMTDEDLALLLHAAETLPNVMVTIAPESTTPAQVTRMADAGITVSLGHTDADYETCIAYFDAGARCVTHLFNAMSQFGNREPGLVGATLMRDDIYAGMIADGIHVHPAALRLALAAKPNADRLFLVSDAMATGGSDIQQFRLNGRDVFRQDQRLTLADGTLAGADLDLGQALAVMTGPVGDKVEDAVARATSTPAHLLREKGDLGRITATTKSVLYLQDGFTDPVFLDLTGAG